MDRPRAVGRLLANTKTDEVETFVVPGLGGPDFDVAMSYLQWVVAELTQRGIEIALHYRPTPEGVAIGLEDITERKNAGPGPLHSASATRS